MSAIRFSKEETAVIVADLQRYFRDELDHELGQLPGQMLLDFIGERLGGYFYNRGLYDAQAVLTAKMDDVVDAVLGLEKPAGKGVR